MSLYSFAHQMEKVKEMAPSRLEVLAKEMTNKNLNFSQLDKPIALNPQLHEVKSEQLEKNREDGANRELLAFDIIKSEFPEEDGYKIEREQYLRDSDGKIVKDPETGEARRVDFVVTADNEVVMSIEVTSETAPKEAQIAKEGRIRETGGSFIKDKDTGQLITIPNDVQTVVRRYP